MFVIEISYRSAEQEAGRTDAKERSQPVAEPRPNIAANLFEIYPIKSCLVNPPNPYPHAFSKTSLENILQSLQFDPGFVAKYHAAEARARRAQRIQTEALPNRERVRQDAVL